MFLTFGSFSAVMLPDVNTGASSKQKKARQKYGGQKFGRGGHVFGISSGAVGCSWSVKFWQ